MPRETKALPTSPRNTKNTVTKPLFVADFTYSTKRTLAGEAHESCLTLPPREEFVVSNVTYWPLWY